MFQQEKPYNFIVQLKKKIDEGATKVHGLTNDFLSSYPSFDDQSTNLLEFIKKDVLIIHNASFDLGFINNEFNILGKPPIENKIIDTVALARNKLNTRIANLNYLCKRFNIDLSERGLHGALLDSQLLAAVYLELKGGKQISMNLNSTEKNKIGKATDKQNKQGDFYKIKLSNNEIKQHKVLVKQIKNSLWEKIDY